MDSPLHLMPVFQFSSVIPSSNQHPRLRLHGLDYLRALAIILVFFFHYSILNKGNPEWLANLSRFGWTGVDLFFVLSGFLISSQLFLTLAKNQPIAFKTFFMKRFFRIIPAYWFTMILYFLVPVFREKEHLPPVWKFLSFTQNLHLNIQDEGTFSHAWSLCVEEHFYLLLPIVLILVRKLKWISHAYWLLVFLFLAGWIVRVVSYQYGYLPRMNSEINWMYWYQYLYYPTYTRLDGILVGVLLGAWYVFNPSSWSRITRYPWLTFVIGLIILFCAYIVCEDQTTFQASVFGFPLVALGYGCWLLAACSEQGFLYNHGSRMMRSIALWSFAIYLTHKGAIHLTQTWLGVGTHQGLLLVCSILMSLAFALLVHELIEKPFLRLRASWFPDGSPRFS